MIRRDQGVRLYELEISQLNKETSRLGNQCIYVYLMSVCQPNSTLSYTRLASRLGGHIHYRLYANLVRHYRILGWHPELLILLYRF